MILQATWIVQSFLIISRKASMKWQWRLGRFFGLMFMSRHVSDPYGWVALNYWRKQNLGAVLIGIGFILALFLCVVLTSMAMPYTARKYGIKTRDITLYPMVVSPAWNACRINPSKSYGSH
jgi:hypothetical protein